MTLFSTPQKNSKNFRTTKIPIRDIKICSLEKNNKGYDEIPDKLSVLQDLLDKLEGLEFYERFVKTDLLF